MKLTVLIVSMIYLSCTNLKKENEQLRKELKECNETSFKRFEHARKLSDICDTFQSSRKAKNKYIRKHEIIE